MSEITDVYEMTPLQAGMLFHSLHSPQEGLYFQQYWCRLEGELDVAAFRAAWDEVIARHDILRSQPQWEELETPVHVIHAAADPAWHVADWQESGDDAARLTEWLAQDRARGFDMGSVPLMRFALIEVAPQAHVFVWSFHHVLIDGWCGALLVREMLEFYGGAQPVSEPVSFRSYVDWLAVQNQTEPASYWRRALEGIEATTALGIDHVQTGGSGTLEQRALLDAQFSADIRDMARHERLTLNTLMQGAWSLILSRYSGQGDVTFGTVLSGRPPELPNVEEMIGMFLTTVPARVNTEASQLLMPWLHALQTEQRLREEFGHVALSDIQRWSGLGAATPLFDSLLIVETYPQSIEAATERDGVCLRMHDTGIYERTNYALTLKVLPAEQIEFVVTADASRIEPAALERLIGHLKQVLRSFVDQPDQTLGDVTLLSQREQQTLLSSGRGPDRARAGQTLTQILEHAVRQPEKNAVLTLDGQSLSYAEIARRSAEIGATLAARGVGRGDIVAVCMDRSLDLVPTLLAVWRTGAAYLPLDPIYPADRIAYILADARACLIVTDTHSRAALGDITGVDILMVQDCVGGTMPSHEPRAEDLAYLLYTSGSTGNPKGVRISHGALCNFLASMLRAPGLSLEDRLLAVTTMSFDIAALELFGPLYAGGQVVLGDQGLGADGKRLKKTLDTLEITVMQATPTGWRVLSEAGWSNAAGIRMLAGGEALDATLARGLLSGGGTLWNLYGPTETTIWSSALQITPDMVQGSKTPVGGPLDNTQLYVQDHAGHLAPLGVPGELMIAGAGLSAGYHNRPELTDDRFIRNRVTGTGKLYRTGDNVRWSEDGTLEFLGRLDDQVKLRGYRIELGEIEARLETHPGVQQAVAMVRDDGIGPRLAGYLRVSGTAPSREDLRAHLRVHLPDYMVPTAWVVLDDFPLTPNGKIDRRALPVPDRNPEHNQATTSPQTDLIGGIWAELLGVDEVTADDNFFDLGGHSLLATRVIGAVGAALSVTVSLRDVFEFPTLGAFCARVTVLQGIAPLPPLARNEGARVLSFAQHRQWLMAQFNPSDTAYLLPLSLRLTGPLDIAALDQALQDVSLQHEILRYSFPALDGQASIAVHPCSEVTLTVDDLEPLDPQAQSEARATAQDIEATTPFDITAAPPWRARVLRYGPENHLLLITLHHILADEWSFGLLLQALQEAYARILAAAPAPKRAPDALQYSDFSAWQRGLDFGSQRDYWRWQLDVAPQLLALPTDYPRPAQRSASGGRVPLHLDAEASAALRAFARGKGVTVFMCLLAAYAVFLHRHTDQDDMVIATPVSNRHQGATQKMIGLFVNTLAIRTEFSQGVTFTELLSQVRETVLAATQNQDIPFEQVIEALDLPRRESHAPLAQTLFAMQTLPQAGDFQADLAWQPEPGNVVNARFDLALTLRDGPGGIDGYLEYASDLFSHSSVCRMARRFEILLGALADHGEASIIDMPLLPDNEQHVCALEGAVSQDTLPDRLAAQNGTGLAIDLGTDAITYHELRRMVAARAHDFDACAGQRVALQRDGVTGLVDFLAVMEAGAIPVLSPRGTKTSDFRVGDDLVTPLTVTPHDLTDHQTVCILRGKNDVELTHAGLMQMSRLPLEAGLRLAWDGTLFGAGLVQCLAGICAGATLVRDHADASLRESHWGYELTQGGAVWSYFDTPEMPMAFCAHKFGSDETIGTNVLGRAQPGVRAYVLQRGGQLSPVGVAGELCLGGAGLARGYHGQPARTAEHFRPNPHFRGQEFDSADTCLWHSGMLVKCDSDGVLHFQGRIDELVNMGGQRIMPSDVETCLASHPAIKAAALRRVENARSVDGIDIALVLGVAVAQPSDAELNRHVLAHLPDYLLPRSYMWMSALPTTSDGVVDYAALMEIDPPRHVMAPQGVVETAFARIWCDVLKVDTIARHDNFFDLGGDSVLAIQIVTRLGDAGYRVDPRMVFHHQTIAALAEIAEPAKPEETAYDLPEIEGLDLGALAAAVSFGND